MLLFYVNDMKKFICFTLLVFLISACSAPNAAEEKSPSNNEETSSESNTGTEGSSEFSLEKAKAALACMQAAGDTSFSNGLAGQIELQEKLPSEQTLKAMQTQIGLYNNANDPDC